MDEINTLNNKMSLNQPEIGNIMSILRRRKWKIVLPFLIVFLITIAVAFVLPTKYRSISTILIQNQEIPSNFVQSTVTTYVDQQLQIINQRTMSRNKLMEIIEKYKLYPEFFGRLPEEEIIEEMRKDVKMNLINADVVDPKTGRPGTATIAFTLSYEGKNPFLVQQVTNALTSLFLGENLKSRTEQTKNVASFFENERDNYYKKLVEVDEKISQLKKEHFDQLPESTALNLQTMEKLERDLANLGNNTKSIMDRKIYLEGQLNLVSAQLGSSLGDKERLNALKMELVNLQSKFSESYPEVLKVKEVIKSLEELIKNKRVYTEKILMLEELKKRPNQEAEINNLLAEIEKLKEKGVYEDVNDKDRELLPSFLNLKTQIVQAEIDLNNMENERNNLKSKLTDYEAKLKEIPNIEQEYLNLNRERNNVELKYREVEGKLAQAKLSENIEKDQKGETFALLEPPMLPEKPYKPNRVAIVLIGFILGAGCGVGLGFLSESLDTSFKTRKELSTFTSIPIFAEIPNIITGDDIKRTRIKIGVGVVIIVSLIAGSLILFNNLVMPLDIFWIKISRIINNKIIVLMN